MFRVRRKIAFINAACNVLQIKNGFNKTSIVSVKETKKEMCEQKLEGVFIQSVGMFCSFKDNSFYILKVMLYISLIII